MHNRTKLRKTTFFIINSDTTHSFYPAHAHSFKRKFLYLQGSLSHSLTAYKFHENTSPFLLSLLLFLQLLLTLSCSLTIHHSCHVNLCHFISSGWRDRSRTRQRHNTWHNHHTGRLSKHIEQTVFISYRTSAYYQALMQPCKVVELVLLNYGGTISTSTSSFFLNHLPWSPPSLPPSLPPSHSLFTPFLPYLRLHPSMTYSSPPILTHTSPSKNV